MKDDKKAQAKAAAGKKKKEEGKVGNNTFRTPSYLRLLSKVNTSNMIYQKQFYYNLLYLSYSRIPNRYYDMARLNSY